MRKVEDYKEHAEECRIMARNTTNDEQRQGLLRMADTWESLAADRVAHMERQKRVGAQFAAFGDSDFAGRRT